jgi:hypothetical protein
MMKRGLVIFLTLVWCSQSATIAQVTEFSSDPSKFVAQMERHLGSFDKKDAKAFAKQFLLVWNTADASVKTRVIVLSNKMAQKRFKPYPDFRNYWAAVYELIGGTSPDPSKFEQWHSCLEKLVENKQNNRFQEFMLASAGLISNNVMYETTVVKWMVRGGAYKFRVEDNKGIIDLEGIRLSCYANDDSTYIESTSGRFDPLTSNIELTGGRFFWTRCGLPSDETFAEMQNVKINAKSSSFRVDTVMLTTPFFEKPIMGLLDEKVMRPVKGRSAAYPVFRSFSQDNLIKGIAEGIDYLGGFSLVGPDFVGIGVPEKKASLYFYNGGDKHFAKVKRNKL